MDLMIKVKIHVIVVFVIPKEARLNAPTASCYQMFS